MEWAESPNADRGSGAPARRRSYGLTRGLDDAADRALSLGEGALAAHEYTAALLHFRKAAHLLPVHPAPVVGEVLARWGAANVPSAFGAARGDPTARDLLEQLNQAPGDTRAFVPYLLHQGRLLLVLGEAAEARVPLERAVQLAPLDAEAHSALGVALLALGHKEQALAALHRATTLDPDLPARHANLATAHMMLGEAEAARAGYQRALQADPDNAVTRNDLATALLALGRPKEALPHLQRAHQLDPERATIANNLGYAWQLLGHTDRAIEWYHQALARDPKLGSAWINLATAYARKQDFDAAEAALERARQLDPTDPRVLRNQEELNALRQPR